MIYIAFIVGVVCLAMAVRHVTGRGFLHQRYETWFLFAASIIMFVTAIFGAPTSGG